MTGVFWVHRETIDQTRGNMVGFKALFPDMKRTLGLDIGSSSIKLVEILDTPNGHHLSHFSQIPLERGVIVEGSIRDGNILGDRIRQLFRMSSCKTKRVVTSLPGHMIFVKRATFPTMAEDEFREMISDEAGYYLPFDSVNDVSFDFQILGEREGHPGRMEVVLVAVKKDVIQSYIDTLEQAGLKPCIIDVDSFALETMYEANYDFEDADVIALINIGSSMTNINVVKGGTSIFTRDIPVGGQSITESIQERLGVTFDEAERIKIEAATVDRQDADCIKVDPLDYAEPLFMEIERSIDYFRSTQGGAYIKDAILSGGSAKIRGITEILSRRLRIETQIVKPIQGIAYNDQVFHPTTLDDIGPIAALGIGLALRRAGDR